MKPNDGQTNKDLKAGRVDYVPSEGRPEDLPLDWMKEDSELSGRKPDLGELEEDSSEL
jgi:hypothetical protein